MLILITSALQMRMDRVMGKGTYYTFKGFKIIT